MGWDEQKARNLTVKVTGLNSQNLSKSCQYSKKSMKILRIFLGVMGLSISIDELVEFGGLLARKMGISFTSTV